MRNAVSHWVARSALALIGPGAVLVAGLVVSTFRPAGAMAACGDCGNDGEVTVDELITMVNVDLGSVDVSACGAGDADGDGTISITEIISAVNNALNSCGASTTPTPTSTPSETSTPADTATPEPTRTTPPTPTPPTTAPSCAFHTGALPAESLPPAAPHGAQIPIEHIVVLMQENRSFDSYFGKLSGVDGLPPNTSNPDADGTPVASFHQTPYCTEDTNHSWGGSHREYDDGQNDGFVTENNPGGARAMGYYDQSDLPFYYSLAVQFATADRYFCSVLSSTYPNRFYLLTGTSFGHIHNDTTAGGWPQRSIFDLLDEQHISWKIYYSDAPFAVFLHVNNRVKNQARIAQFYTDAAAGTLPQVSFVDPAFTPLLGPQTDEHPPANLQDGQQFVSKVVAALTGSPLWPTSALFLTYDEHGGFYDHVPPPSACIPDDIPPMLDGGGPAAQFDRYGFRVPFMLVSPYARPGYVSHNVYDHTSILRFIETRFDLPALTDRDANADPLLDLFDFTQPALLDPPMLSPATIDPERAAQCAAGN